MAVSTQIRNGTKHVMKVLVGSGRHISELATVEAGGKYVIAVDYNATYREYTVGVDAPGLEKFVVSSDDLCDNNCITIKEEGSKLTVQKEPRQSTTAPASGTTSKALKKHSWLPSWMLASF